MDKAWSEHREATKNEKKPNSRKLCVEIKAVYSKSRHIARPAASTSEKLK
jgi:hypothetical protein